MPLTNNIMVKKQILWSTQKIQKNLFVVNKNLESSIDKKISIKNKLQFICQGQLEKQIF